MPPKVASSAAAADVGQCNLCEQPVHTGARRQAVVVRRPSARMTVFHCTHCRGGLKGAWHVDCVHEQFDKDERQIEIRCSVCDTFVTARRSPSWWSTLFRLAWTSYPAPEWLPFVVRMSLNVCCDVVALMVGFCMMVMLYSVAPYSDTYQPGIGEYIVYQVMPHQFERIRTQAVDSHNPSLAVATFIAAWIVGWMTISLPCVLLRACRFRRQQSSRGITIQ